MWFKRQNLVEWRAGQIDDPVERLRFLRQAAERAPERASGPLNRLLPAEFWRSRGNWIVLGVTLLTFLSLTPGHTTSRVPAAKESPKQSIKTAPDRPVVAFHERSGQRPSAVWLIDTRDGVENYSNGLRIDNKYAVANEPRAEYAIYGYGKTGEGVAATRNDPAGIVYHTTESHLAPFEPKQSRRIQRIGAAVIEHARENRSYHFVIDRFGRVFRIVKESDIANHAGMSVWGDERGAYVNLNASFLAIAFETATAETEIPDATPAQVISGRVLTEMLRARYKIPAANCVTHAQVSVNASNMLIGYHTDWAASFPFGELGLPDNYLTPPPSMIAFGFGYDGHYVEQTGNRVWQGLLAAEYQVQRQAAAAAMPVPKYISALQQRYRQIIAVLKSKSPEKEKGDET